jgi:hypothetical protein
MNRGGAAALTFAILFSMYVSSGYRSEAPRPAPSRAENPAEAQKEPAVPPPCRFDCSPKYPEKLALTLRNSYLNGEESGVVAPGCPVRYQGIDSTLKAAAANAQFFLVIVPDPVHTHLGLAFDRQIDAIGQAAQDNGYLFDRAIMPWDYQDHPESADFRIRLLERAYQDENEKEPGLMIFRKSKGNGSLLALVVGETPTGGIHKDQFQNALHIMQCLRSSEQLKGLALPILGPTFSGSLPSLKKMLQEHAIAAVFCGFHVFSGTVSSSTSVTNFQTDLPIFASFTESADLQELLFVRFLAHRRYQPERVAILAEDETAYGDLGSPRPGSGVHCPAMAGSQLTYDQFRSCVVHVYFPREISQLRSAYQREQESASYGASEREPYRSTLKRDLEGVGSDDDSVHTYSRRQLPLSQEGVLLGILTTLHKHAIEFVILRAGDALDEVFLARYLRQADSDLRIVTVENDLLLRREVEDRLLFGTLSISTYSMRPAANESIREVELGDVHRDRVFPSPYEIGTYNAMAALMSLPQSCASPAAEPTAQPPCPSSKSEDGRLRFESCVRLEDYGWPYRLTGPPPCGVTVEAPPVWLTVLGRDGFWPVALLSPEENPKNPDEPVSLLSRLEQHPTGEPDKAPGTWAWKALCGFTITIAIFYMVFVLPKIGSTSSTSQIFQQFAARTPDCRVIAFAIQWFLLLLALLLLLWPWLHGGVGVSCVWLVLLVLAGTGVACFAGYDLSVRCDAKRPARTECAIVTLIVGCLVGVAAACWPLEPHVPDHNAVWHLFFYRYVHVAWWVSPLTPFLFLIAAGLWWAWHRIQGAAHLDARMPQLPKVSVNTTGEKFPKDLEHLGSDNFCELTGALAPAKWVGRVHGPLVGLFFLAVFLIDWCHPVSSLEDRWYDVAYGVSLLIAIVILFSSLLRAYFIWVNTKRLLLRLDASLLRRGFDRLPGFSLMPFWGLGANNLLDREHVGRAEVQLLQTAVKTVGYQLSEGKTVLKDVEKAVHKIGDNDKNEERLDKLQEFYTNVATAAAAFLKYLSGQWRDETYGTPRECRRGTSAAEDFVALVYANFIQVILIQIRSLIIASCGMFVFIVGSLNVYPFQPKATLRNLTIILLMAIVWVVVLVLTQIRRDATLSRITDTKPGQLGGDFWLKLLQFGALPLLSLLAAQFPEVANFLFSWLEPASRGG